MPNLTNAIPQFMGARIRRREDPALISGQGKYVADIQLDGLLHAAILRSPYAHATILSIDTSAAEAMEGVVAVLTGAEINPKVNGPLPMVIPLDDYEVKRNPPHYLLTEDKVRHVGDPVAVVVAESPYLAADALETIMVDYDPLPVVTSSQAALADGAPLLHEDGDDNVAFKQTMDSGDVDAAFAAADTVIELSLLNQRLIPNAMEPRAVTADYDPASGSLTVWSTTQIPHALRDELVNMLEMPAEQVRVIAPEVGGGFGAKGNIYGEEVLVPFLARQLKRPVSWTASRSEDFMATCHGRDQIDIVRLAADRNGQVTAIDLKVIADVGGYYTRVTPAIAPSTALMMTGVYAIPNARAEVMAVFTNRHPTEPYRGAGRPEGAFLIERAMTYLAAELELDPAELRRRNFIPPDRFPYKTSTGATYDSGEYARALERALELIDYTGLRSEQQRRQAGGPLLGIGLACYVEICGFGPWEMGSVIVDDQARVTVLTGTSPQGQGHQTSWAQIAASALQIPLNDITVKHGDTAVVPRGIGTFGSRSAAVGGSAVLGNAETIRQRAEEIAAHLLEAAPADMELQEGRFQVRGVPDRSLTWAEIAQAAYHDTSLPEALQGSLEGDQDYTPKGETFPFGVHICVVEVDPGTGYVQIMRYLTVDDCGRVINPMLVEGQLHGGIAQGIGQALFEGAIYDELGNLLSGSLMDYALPKAHRLPAYETNRTETPSPLNPLGVKGVGEAATIGSTPAMANAVIDALSAVGIRHLDMPLTPEKIWQALQGAKH